MKCETRFDRLLSEARARIVSFARREFREVKRFCCICGVPIVTSTPIVITCSPECQSVYFDDSNEYQSVLLYNSLPKAVKVLDEIPYEEWVYFIQDSGSGLIKIGYSTNVNSRLQAIQQGMPTEVKLLKYIHGDKELESELHERFSESRQRGEWFKPTNELLEFVESL
jgi:hypothetical protein